MKYLGWIVAGVFAIMTLVVSLRPRKIETIEVVKTLTKVDSIYLEKPIYVEKRVVDTMRVGVPIKETVIVRDTIYVYLEREEKIFGDSRYKAQISGYDPQLDWIYIFQENTTKFVEVPKKRERLGIGVQSGVGVGPNGIQPYIGIGLSYNLLTW